MKLTLTQAATKLGKSERQVAYMIQTGRVQASKNGKQWVIESDSLPLGEGQVAAVQRQQDAMVTRAAEVLGEAQAKAILGPPEPKRTYSVTLLKAFPICLAIYRDGARDLSEEHAAMDHLRTMLELLTLGCHRYHKEDKLASYGLARDSGSRAVCALFTDGRPEAERLAIRLEQEALPAVTSLIARIDRKWRAP